MTSLVPLACANEPPPPCHWKKARHGNRWTRMWYRVEWSPAIATPEVHNLKNAWCDNFSPDSYISFPMNRSQSIRSQSHAKNLGGTFRYVQRLRSAPTDY